MTNRFAVAWFKGSDDTLGWNGCLVDNATGERHTLRNYVRFEEFQGETTWTRAAFDTKADLTKAAMRRARELAG